MAFGRATRGILPLLGAFSFVAILASGPALASGPSSNRILNYQLRLTDASGIPVADGTKNLKLTFYTAPSGGTQLYTFCATTDSPTGTPESLPVTFANGTASVLIGDTGITCNSSGFEQAIPATLFDNTAIYLGVTVNADAEMTPRKRIVAAGFALNADKLDDLDTSAAGGSNAFVPVTDSSGNFTLTRNVTVDTDTFFVDATNNRIGIGTVAPAEALEIAGTTPTLYMNGSTSGLISWSLAGVGAPAFTTRSAGTKLVLFPGITASQVDYALGIDAFTMWYSVPQANSSHFHKFYAGTTELMRIRGDGNVGIGDTTPDALLDVAGTFQTDGSAVIGDATTDRLTITGETRLGLISADPTGTNGLMYYNSTDNKFRCYQASAWTDCIGSGGGASIGGTVTSGTAGSVLFVNSGPVLAQDNANFFWDDSNNRLGIGTVSPGTMLEVQAALSNGTEDSFLIFDSANSAANSGSSIDFKNDNTAGAGFYSAIAGIDDGDKDGRIEFRVSNNAVANTTRLTASDTVMTINQLGFVGIGDITPDALLDATHTSTSTAAATELAAVIDFSDTGIVTTGTDLTNGLDINLTRSGATGGTITSTGLDVDVTGTTGGTSTAVGIDVTVSGADANYAALFSGGNVGIGTSTPGYKLHVLGNSAEEQLVRFESADVNYTAASVSNTTQTSNASFYMTVGGSVGLSVFGLGTQAGIASLEVNSDNQGIIGNRRNAPLKFATNDAVRVTIDAAGNFGIGDTTPDSLLDVTSALASDGIFIDNAATTGDPVLSFRLSDVGQFTMGVDDSTTNDDFVFSDGSALGTNNRFSVSGSTGNITVHSTTAAGAVSPTTGQLIFDNQFDNSGNATANKIVLFDDGTTFRAGFGISTSNLDIFSGGAFRFFVDHLNETTMGTEALSIDAAGNVGIGDPTPDAKLDVAGTFRTDGALTFGDASADTVTSNAAAWTFVNDTTVALTGGVDGINFDANTLSIDATNNRVGIGTNAPTAPLHVRSGSVPDILIEETFATSAAQIQYQNATRTWEMGGDASPDGFYLQPSTGAFGQGTFFLDPNGNLSLGTTTTSTHLSVGSSTSTADEILRITGQNDAAIQLFADTDNVTEDHNAYIQMTQDPGTGREAFVGLVGNAATDPANGGYTGTLANALFVGNSDATPIQFGTNDNVRMTIDGSGNVGIGDTSPASLLTVGDGDRFNVNASGDVTSTFTTLDGSTTTTGSGTNSTSLAVTSGTSFNDGNYVQVASAACVANPCFAKITAGGGTGTLTISPALSWNAADTVTEVHVPEIGGVDLTQALANRYGRGYFIDGIVTGNGSTHFSDNRIESGGTLAVNAGGQAVTLGGSLTVTGAITSNSASNSVLNGPLRLANLSGADPTGTNGLTYYNTTTNKFRCYQNSGWTDCIGAGSSPAWSSLTNPSTNLSLTMAANTTTFNITQAADTGTTASAFTYVFNVPQDTTGTNVHNAIAITPSLTENPSGGTNTANLIRINDFTGDAQMNINAVSIGDHTGGADATERALVVGAGWDSALYINGTSVFDGSGNLTSSNASTLGDAATDAITFNGEIRNASPLRFEGATNNDIYTFLAVTDPTVSDKTITFPNLSGTVALLALDQFDFVDFEDTLDLDAALAINQTTNAWSQSYTGTATGLTYTANSIGTGGSALRINTTPSNGDTQVALGTGSALHIAETATDGGSAFVLDFTDTAGTTETSYGQYLIYRNQGTADAHTAYAMKIENADVGADPSDDSIDGLLLIDQADADTPGGNVPVVSALHVTSSGNAGITNGIQIAGANVTNGINLSGTFGTNLVTSTNFTVSAGGNLTANGTFTFGDASGDAVTSNAAAWTFANDTTVALTGGVNGINFDSNTLSIDATNNRVGIGTNAPVGVLEIEGATNSMIVLQRTDAGVPQIVFQTTGGTDDSTLSYDNSNDYLYLANGGSARLVVNDSGNVGVSVLASATSNTLCYNTTPILGFNVFSTCSSSLRYKEDVRDLAFDMQKVLALRPVDFKWKDRDERSVGFIAEEVAQIIPEVITYKDGQIEGIEYKLLTAYLVGALKDHEARIAALGGGKLSLQADGTYTVAELVADRVKARETVISAEGNDRLVGRGAIDTGSDAVVVTNLGMKANSLVVVTFDGDPGSRWWISERHAGTFIIKLAAPATQNVTFTYWIIGVEGELAEPVVVSPPPSPEPPPAPPAEEPPALPEPAPVPEPQLEPAPEQPPAEEPAPQE